MDSLTNIFQGFHSLPDLFHSFYWKHAKRTNKTKALEKKMHAKETQKKHWIHLHSFCLSTLEWI